MARLILADGIGDMTKAIISAWFRAPAAALTAANVNHSTGLWPVMPNVLPLLTWGPQRTGTISNFESNYPSAGLSGPASTSAATTPPSYIGIQCSGGNHIEVNLQTSSNNSTTATSYAVTNIDFVSDGPPDPLLGVVTYTNVDESTTQQGGFDYFGNSGYGTTVTTPLWRWGDGGSFLQSQPPMGATDKWHHILLSWDLTNGCAARGNGLPFTFDTPGTGVILHGPAPLNLSDLITAFSKMWFAYDDVNKSGINLPAIWAGNHTVDNIIPDIDPNGIISGYCSDIYNHQNDLLALAVNDHNSFTYTNFGTPEISTGGTIDSAPLIIPGPASLLEYTGTTNNNVELAELQIYTGITLDTSILTNRRLFVTSAGKPQTKDIAAAALGQQPKVYLGKTSSNWISGKNLGTAGNFTPGGTIAPFTPGPALG